jgi:hypothetical protein
LTSGITTNVTDSQTGVTTKYYFLFTWDNIDYLQPKVSIKGQLVSPEYYQVNAINGSIVAQYQNGSYYLEIVVDTVNSGTTNRFGSQVFRGGIDPINTPHSLSIIQYSYTASTAQVY